MSNQFLADNQFLAQHRNREAWYPDCTIQGCSTPKFNNFGLDVVIVYPTSSYCRATVIFTFLLERCRLPEVKLFNHYSIGSSTVIIKL